MAAISRLAKSAEQFKPPLGQMPTRVLGKTGVVVSLLALGGAGAVTDFPSDDLAAKFIQDCVAAGISYLDTAANYGPDNDLRRSERRYGKALGKLRNKIYLNTTTLERKADAAMRSIETSLQLLQTDHLDSVQIHSVTPQDDVASWGKPDGVYTLLRKLKDQKVIRFIGVTGHTDANCLKQAVETYEFDTILTTFNPTRDRQPYEEVLLPKLQEENLGIVAMKIMGGARAYNRGTTEGLPGMLVGQGKGLTTAPTLLRYALSLPIHTATNGIDDYNQLGANLTVCYNFKPMTRQERKEVLLAMSDSDKFLAYNKPGYLGA